MSEEERASMQRVLATIKSEAMKMKAGQMKGRIAPPTAPVALGDTAQPDEGTPDEEAAESPMQESAEMASPSSDDAMLEEIRKLIERA